MEHMNAAINDSPTIVDIAGTPLPSPAMKALKYDSEGKLIFAGAGDNAIGIALATATDIKANGRIEAQIKDIGMWITGAAVSKGAELACDMEGKAVTATSGAFIVAIALESAPSKDTMLQVQIVKCGYKA